MTAHRRDTEFVDGAWIGVIGTVIGAGAAYLAQWVNAGRQRRWQVEDQKRTLRHDSDSQLRTLRLERYSEFNAALDAAQQALMRLEGNARLRSRRPAAIPEPRDLEPLAELVAPAVQALSSVRRMADDLVLIAGRGVRIVAEDAATLSWKAADQAERMPDIPNRWYDDLKDASERLTDLANRFYNAVDNCRTAMRSETTGLPHDRPVVLDRDRPRDSR